MDFNSFWDIVKNHGSVAQLHRLECEDLWSTFTETQQEAICRAIGNKMRTGRFVHYNPAIAMRENLPKETRQVLSFDDYYALFGTTNPINGFQKVFLPEQQKTIYIKN